MKHLAMILGLFIGAFIGVVDFFMDGAIRGSFAITGWLDVAEHLAFSLIGLAVGYLAERFRSEYRELAAVKDSLEQAQRELLRRNRELAILNVIIESLNQSLDLSEALQEPLDILVEQLDLQAGWVSLCDSQGPGAFDLVADRGLPPALAADDGRELRWSPCRCQRMLLDGELTEAVNVVACERLKKARGEKEGLLHHATVPIRAGDRFVGVMNLANPEWEPFSAEMLQTLSYVGQQMNMAIERARLYELARGQRIREQAMLLELSEGLLATLELQEVMDRAAETAARVLRAEVGVVTLPDEAGQELVFRAVHGWEKELVGRIRVGLGPESAGGYALLSRSPVMVDDVPGDPRFPPAPFLLEKGVQSMAIVPMVLRGEEVGALTVATLQPRRFSQDEVRLLSLVANQTAVAIQKARLHEGTLRLAMTDALTGLCNRRHFYQVLERELARVDRYDQTVSLIMLDIDDFKPYNDIHGHLAGDELLRDLASILCGLARQVDTAARYGGEEFALLLPQTGRAGALAVTERLRAAVEGHAFDAGRVTISAGVAVYPADASTAEGLVNAADMALYQAKRAGKNRVYVCNTGRAGRSPNGKEEKR